MSKPRVVLIAIDACDHHVVRRFAAEGRLPNIARLLDEGAQAPVENPFGLLVGACGLLAISLAVIGIYGVVAYAVSRRTREIGIRMALGADKQKILRLVMRQGMILVGYGLSAGLLLALALTRALTSSIFPVPILNGVSATDPLTFGSITLLLILAALLACYVPARRATTVDPMVALRCE